MTERNPFNTHFSEYDAWFDAFPNIYHSELRAIEALLPPPGDWVEVGVGSARFASQLGIPIGIEPSDKMASLARQRGIKLIEGRVEALPLGDASVDAVFLITVLCFVRELERALREVVRVLRPGGHAIVASVPRDSAVGQIYDNAGPEDLFFHQAFLRSTREMIDGMEAAGFTIDRTLQTLLGPPDRANDRVQKPQDGHDRGSFVVIRGRRNALV